MLLRLLVIWSTYTRKLYRNGITTRLKNINVIRRFTLSVYICMYENMYCKHVYKIDIPEGHSRVSKERKYNNENF